jgi:Uri superfamily endonuclease
MALLRSAIRSPLIFLGDATSTGGTYVLRIRVRSPMAISFGRFRGGKPILFLPADYAYVGSALAKHGATCLSRRLMRHAARADKQPPHSIQRVMQAAFVRKGMGHGDLRPLSGKRFHWHVDYLLDHASVELVGAYVIRSPRPIEADLGRMLAADPGVAIIEPGLGASDIPGNTNLLAVRNRKWWRSLPEKLQPLLSANAADLS